MAERRSGGAKPRSTGKGRGQSKGRGSKTAKGPRKNSRQSRGHKSLDNYPQFEGTVQMTREGFIFVIVPGEQDDIYVKQTRTKNALNGDKVKVALTREKVGDKRREGEVISIIERSSRSHVGVYHTIGAQAWVLMQSKNMPYDIEVDAEAAAAMGAKQGMKVAALVDRWEKYDMSPKGHLTDVLGMPGDNDTEMHAILAEFGLPYRFEKEVEDAADQISEDITAKDMKGRRDFRDTLTFTIDPADAKDFDDALSFKILPNGNYEVGVHIADVSWYVLPGTAVDKEAQERGTSVYLVDRTVPMLPEKLCNKLCSLRPNEDKLTFSAVFEITPLAKIVDRWFGRTAICSRYRFSYEQAQEVIERKVAETKSKEKAPAVWGEEIEDALIKLHKLAQMLKDRRFRAGAISFERPEMKVDVDENGKPIGVHQHISKEANWLIEEFMLLANRSVAEYIATSGKMNGRAAKDAKTFVYRIHDEPNGEKIESLRKFAGNFGYKMDESNGNRAIAKSLNELLTSAKDKPECNAFEMLALRSMAKAKYSTVNIGHYGLAFDFYTHFTSPIRRYPDTMVHRLLAMYLSGENSQNQAYYEEQCVHASDRESIAAEAERASIKYKLVEFMEDKVGQEFDGSISGLTDWGIYVEIEPTKIEGMVSLRDIKADFFEFDAENYRTVGRRTRRVFRLGDKVRIRVKGTNLEQKILDYELVEEALEPIPVEKREEVRAPKQRRSRNKYR